MRRSTSVATGSPTPSRGLPAPPAPQSQPIRTQQLAPADMLGVIGKPAPLPPLKHLPFILKGGTPPRYSTTYGGIDVFNAQMTQEKKDLPVKEVFRQMNDVHSRLISLLSHLPESELGSKTRFRHRLRLDTYGHYPKHTRAIRKWREKKGPIEDLQSSAAFESAEETAQRRLW